MAAEASRGVTARGLFAFAFAPILGVGTFSIADMVIRGAFNPLSLIANGPTAIVGIVGSFLFGLPVYALFRRLGWVNPITIMSAAILGTVFCWMFLNFYALAFIRYDFTTPPFEKTLAEVVSDYRNLTFAELGFFVGCWFMVLRGSVR
jgi:hypothetical protein